MWSRTVLGLIAPALTLASVVLVGCGFTDPAGNWDRELDTAFLDAAVLDLSIEGAEPDEAAWSISGAGWGTEPNHNASRLHTRRTWSGATTETSMLAFEQLRDLGVEFDRAGCSASMNASGLYLHAGIQVRVHGTFDAGDSEFRVLIVGRPDSEPRTAIQRIPGVARGFDEGCPHLDAVGLSSAP